jgi:glycosyltransferase involved in cell wall biosynthesis
MKVFIPHKKDRNVYFDEIINSSNSEFSFGYFKDYDASYYVVNIQFPEAIFDLEIPTKEQLIELEKAMIQWKERSKIVLTLNDDKSHYDEENKYGDLFKLINKNVDGVIHLGQYSLESYKNDFPKNCKHAVIFHPLYESLLSKNNSANFEEKFNLDFEDKYVVAAIGAIRSLEEVNLLLKMFKSLPQKNKLLVVPNMFNFKQKPNFVPYRFRKIYNYLAEKRYCFPLKKEQYFFGYNFIDYELMVDLVKKSSLVAIPRKRNLNSGNLFLGLTFDKPMIIPKIGNMTEIAELFGFSVLDLEQNNFKKNLLQVAESNDKFRPSENKYQELKKRFSPEEIAKQYGSFFNELIKNK